MTFTEAALEILKREGKPLHFKELTERAMTKKLLTFVGRTPEVTMQTQLTAAVKKAPGNPFVRVKPGVFGLLRYPEMPASENGRNGGREAARETAEDRAASEKSTDKDKADKDKKEEKRRVPEKRAADEATDERGRRRRRRGGRGRGAAKEGEAAATPAGDEQTEALAAASARDAADKSSHEEADDEPSAGGLSAEARAAALAETGVLEGDEFEDSDHGHGLGSGAEGGHDAPASRGRGQTPSEDKSEDKSDDLSGDLSDDQPDDLSGDRAGGETRNLAPGGVDQDLGASDEGDDEEDAFGPPPELGEGGKVAEGDDPARRRRRRRRRRRGGVGGEAELGGTGAEAQGSPRTGAAPGTESAAPSPAITAPLADVPTGENASAAGGEPASESESAAGSAAGQAARKIMAPADAAIEILRSQPPGRGVHVRQIADSAIRRRLIHGEPNEAWRVIRTSLAAEPKDRLRNGLRPRVRSAGSGLYALARRTPDADLEKAEQVFGEARRALRERTIAALEKRITDLPPGAFEALARVLLQREGFGPTTFVKRVEGTIYVEALRGRGSRPSKCLIALRPGGSSAGRRAIGELRAGVRARGQDEALLMLGGRLAEDAIAEWKQPGCPLEIADGAALAETCARHGVGVLSASVNVDFVDADFFAELAEG